MPAECGLPHDHEGHLEQRDGVIFKCDGDSSKRPNYDSSAPNKPGM